MNAGQIVLEEVMRAALDAARAAARQAAAGDRHAAGQVYAYHNVLDVFKQQADLLGMKIDDAELAIINAHGLDIASFVNGGGGLFSHAEESFGGNNAPEPYGWLTSIFPGIGIVPEFAFSLSGVEITQDGKDAFPGLTDADLSTGPWHNYFIVPPTITVLTPLATALNNAGERVPLILTSIGATVTPLTVTWPYGRPLRRQTEPSPSAVSFSAAVGLDFQHQIVSGYPVVRSIVVPLFALGYPAKPFV